MTSGWPQKQLSEVVDFNPHLDKSAYRDDLEVSFVPMAAVEAGSGRMEVSQARRFSTVKKGYTPFREGDVLFAKITPCMENGKMAVVPKLSNGLGFGSTEFHVLRPHQGIDPRYVYYFVSSQGFRREAAHRMTGAVGQKRVPKSFLEEASIPAPLFADQQLIVAEIEKQFSRLDEAVANLKRVKANLKRYKAAVLKAAVEGKLTEEWRQQHPEVEPATKLLERILAERRAKWKGRGKYKEPVEPETNNLAPIPNSWTWAALEQLCPRFVDSAHRTPRYGQTGVPALGPRDVVGGKLNVTDARLVDKAEYAIQTERHVPEAGDIVYSRELSLGWGAILPLGVPVCLSQGMCLFRPHKAVDPRYFMIVLNGPHGRHQAELAATGSAHPHVNLGNIKKYSIPLSPSPEQEQIIAEVERRLSVIEELEVAVEANLTRADRLRQSILATAFLGRLSVGTPKFARQSINPPVH
jgi:type I restriction enzyme S subunit